MQFVIPQSGAGWKHPIRCKSIHSWQSHDELPREETHFWTSPHFARRQVTAYWVYHSPPHLTEAHGCSVLYLQNPPQQLIQTLPHAKSSRLPRVDNLPSYLRKKSRSCKRSDLICPPLHQKTSLKLSSSQHFSIPSLPVSKKMNYSFQSPYPSFKNQFPCHPFL